MSMKLREGEQTLTMPQFWEAERKGRDREDKPEYKVRISAAFVSNRVNRIEYYHNSSWPKSRSRMWPTVWCW